VQARLDDRSDRRGRALLLALARDRRGRGEGIADLCVCGRSGGAAQDPGAPVPRRGPPGVEAAGRGGDAMSLAMPATRDSRAPYHVEGIRRDFPILSQLVHGKPLVYLDNAATTQKPICVIEAERRVYEEYYANVHRGVHLLSVIATERLEAVREKVRRLVGAADAR